MLFFIFDPQPGADTAKRILLSWNAAGGGEGQKFVLYPRSGRGPLIRVDYLHRPAEGSLASADRTCFLRPPPPILFTSSITFSVNLEARGFRNLNLNLYIRIRTSPVVEKKPAFHLVRKAQEQLSVS